MVTKDMLRKTFLAICEKANIKDDVIIAYEDALDKKFEEAGISRDSKEAKDIYSHASEYCLPWLVDGMVTDEVVRYINENMKLVPIVSVPKGSDIDELFKFGKNEIAIVGIWNEALDENCEEHYEFFPYLFPMKACNVSGFGPNIGGFIGNFQYSIGDMITYILEDGSFLTVEEKSYGYDGKEEYIFRKIVDVSPSLFGLDEMFAERSQGFFDW